MQVEKLKRLLPLLAFGLVIWLTFEDRFQDALILFFLLFSYILIQVFKNNNELVEEEELVVQPTAPAISKAAYLTYYGDELDFTEESIELILTKRFSYFNKLSELEKNRFITRLQAFMDDKVFKIHDKNGFKEMPILISAVAIQLTFGLQKFKLPNFEFIHVFPREFMRTQPSISLLEGNVSGHAINLSWKHFLEGIENNKDGQNVGLHEMAHALYYQTFIVEENVDNNFRNLYDDFEADGNKVYNIEVSATLGLYSDYAHRNQQEFWAESVELFFEKPRDLKSHYPSLFESMKELLNQDPLNTFASVIG